jgi:Protein of unknown function (DUF3891)
MLHRQDPAGLIVIGQPAHAWLAGQLARAWGNEHVGDVAPWEEVCLAAEQHDLAHALWERTPRLNPQTGRPYSFLDMPANMRLALVSSASALIMAQSRYAALLVSLHFTGLYETYDLRRASGEEGQAMQDFLAREDTFQQQMLASLRDDPTYTPYATPEMVARNRHLLRTWDALSLALCFGLQPVKSFSHVPTKSGETTLTVTRVEDDPTRGTVDPWPFHQEAITLRCEGRRLPETFADEEAMREAFTHAPWVTISMQLVSR